METNDPQQVLAATALMNALLVLATFVVFWAGVLVARRLGRPAGYSLAPLGLARPEGGAFAGAMLGVLFGLGAVVATGVVRLVTVPIFESFGLSTESNVQQPFMQGLQGWVQENPQLAIPVIVAVVVITGPFMEELVFRGVIFNGLNRLGRLALASIGGPSSSRKAGVRASFAFAALVSSAFFALLHLEPVLLPAFIVLAVALCFLFERTGSLIPCFAAHATFNGFTVLLIVLTALGFLPQSI